jgi:hypothetical protein
MATEQQKIKKVIEAYAEFERTMDGLDKEKNALIAKIRQELDQTKVKEMLNTLKSM